MSLGSQKFCEEFDEAHRTCSVPECNEPLMTGECFVRESGELVELCSTHTKLAKEAGIKTISRDEYQRQQFLARGGETAEQIAEKRRRKDLNFLKIGK